MPPQTNHGGPLAGQRQRPGFSLMELIAAVAIVSVVAALIVVRVSGGNDRAEAETCHAQRAEIELQAQLWLRNTGSFPAANLSDIGVDAAYFPEGLPTCPVDGTPYTITPSDGRVVGHNH